MEANMHTLATLEGDNIAVELRFAAVFVENATEGLETLIGKIVINAARSVIAEGKSKAKTEQELEVERIAELMRQAKANPGQVATAETDGG
jgi:hypothetical protein